MSVFDQLARLGIKLPPVAAPVAAYVPATQVGTQVWTSGQLPFIEGELAAVGVVGNGVDEARAKECARVAVLNALAAVDAQAGLENVSRIVKLTVFVASAPDFHAQPQVANGASELVGELFGEAGVHVRSAVGVSALPLNAPVEVELVAELKVPESS